MVPGLAWRAGRRPTGMSMLRSWGCPNKLTAEREGLVSQSCAMVGNEGGVEGGVVLIGEDRTPYNVVCIPSCMYAPTPLMLHGAVNIDE